MDSVVGIRSEAQKGACWSQVCTARAKCRVTA